MDQNEDRFELLCQFSLCVAQIKPEVLEKSGGSGSSRNTGTRILLSSHLDLHVLSGSYI